MSCFIVTGYSNISLYVHKLLKYLLVSAFERRLIAVLILFTACWHGDWAGGPPVTQRHETIVWRIVGPIWTLPSLQCSPKLQTQAILT
jgi:hypothetical protein